MFFLLWKDKQKAQCCRYVTYNLQATSVEDHSNGGHSSSHNGSNTTNGASSNTITVGIKIKAIVGLPPALAHFVYCEYRFWGDVEYTVVPTALEPRGGGRTRKAADTVDFKFDHCRTVQVRKAWRVDRIGPESYNDFQKMVCSYV